MNSVGVPRAGRVLSREREEVLDCEFVRSEELRGAPSEVVGRVAVDLEVLTHPERGNVVTLSRVLQDEQPLVGVGVERCVRNDVARTFGDEPVLGVALEHGVPFCRERN